MKNKSEDYRYPGCAAINQRVKKAQLHQQAWYRDEIVKAAMWERIVKFVAATAAFISRQKLVHLPVPLTKKEPGYKTRRI